MVPTVEMDSRPARVRLNVTDTGSSPAYTQATVLRVNPDGRTSTVRTPDGNPLTLTTSGVTRVGLVYDYEAPYGLPVTYTTEENPATVSGQVTVNVAEVWLIHPGVPELSMPVELLAGSLAEEEWAVTQAAYWPLGREYPVVHTDGMRKAPTSSLLVSVDNLTDEARVRAVVRDTSALLLNIPTSLDYGMDASYIAIGSVKNRRVTDIGGDAHRAIELPFQVVDRPAGGTQADRTYADLLVYASYSALQASYATYQDVLSGP